MPESAKGRVQHQKRNQKATFQWPFGFALGVIRDYSFWLKIAPSDGKNCVWQGMVHAPYHTLWEKQLMGKG